MEFLLNMPFLLHLVSPDIWSCKSNGILGLIKDLTDFLEELEVIGVELEQVFDRLTMTYILPTVDGLEEVIPSFSTIKAR